jgi:hypothetical protein
MGRKLVMRAAVLALLIGMAPTAAPAAAPPEWELALRELDSLVHEISLINLVNGLLLTREQTTQLLELAKQMEAIAPKAATAGQLPSEVTACRRTYLELRERLLKGEAVPADLAQRVVEARAAHSRYVRSTLLEGPRGIDSSCTHCHGPPQADRRDEPMALAPSTRFQMDIAHIYADYGLAGMVQLPKVSAKVDTILGEGRRGLFAKYACCLVPPSDLANPVRVGQADYGEKEMELLRGVRKIPAADWPVAREALCRGMDWVTELVSPGATAARKAEARETLGKVMDRARALSALEFELEKDSLAKDVGKLSTPPQDDWREKAAFFLLVPGSVKIYESYLERLSREEKAGAAKPQ